MLCDVDVTFPELVLRVADTDEGDGRTIEGIIVPWDSPAYVTRPIPGWESYRRGALDRSLNESGRPIPLMLHRHGDDATPAAVLTAHENQDRGHWASFRTLDTTAGRDAVELVRAGVYTGLSIGAISIPARTTLRRGVGGRTMIERSEVRLDHVALLRKPAFDDAQVLALRGEEPPAFVEWDPVAVAEARRRVLNRVRVRIASERRHLTRPGG